MAGNVKGQIQQLCKNTLIAHVMKTKTILLPCRSVLDAA